MAETRTPKREIKDCTECGAKKSVTHFQDEKGFGHNCSVCGDCDGEPWEFPEGVDSPEATAAQERQNDTLYHALYGQKAVEEIIDNG